MIGTWNFFLKPMPIINKLSHHAYLLVGTSSLRNLLVDELLTVHNISLKANLDFFDHSYDTFNIEDARNVKTFHETKPIGSSGKKIFILSMNGITIEAQNALLKLLEEPSEYSHFFLILPSAHLLLPTVKSRMQIVDVMKSERDGAKSALSTLSAEALRMRSEAKQFLKLSSGKRIETLKSLIDDISKEKKTKQDAINFLNDIEAVVYEEKGVKEGREMLNKISLARKYLNDRAPSMKMLLEMVAI